jgi:hypothetical protein
MKIRPLTLPCALLAVLCSAVAAHAQDQKGMKPFAMDHRRAFLAPSPVDVSFLLDAPAGKHGFLRVRDGHLATEDGQRIRLWGVNVTDWSPGSRQIPTKEDAPLWAATLARFGINSVRFQFLDLQTPRGLIKPGSNTRSLDSEQFDREDFFIAELEKRGIYVDFNLLVGRPFSEGDGVHDANQLHEGAKGVSLFDARLIELQKEYAQQLLTHRNPYTRLEYTQDPAVAIVEINNEDAINVGFRAPSSFYEQELIALYNHWLTQHRTPEQIAALRALCGVATSEPIPLITRMGEPARTPSLRLYTEAEFYTGLQQGYFNDMEAYLKQTLGSQSLVIATADHNHKGSGYPLLLAESSMDIIDGHTYWQHPEYYVRKSPMVNDPSNSTVVELARTAIAGKPYTVSEVNNAYPNDYAGEGIPILAAYAGLQDWDGIFWYTFEPKSDPSWKPSIGDPFDISLDPVRMPELAAGALLFLRPDLEKARSLRERSYSRDQVFDSMLLPSGDRPFFTPGYPLDLPLEHEVRISSLNGPPTQPFNEERSPSPIVSDTHELKWFTSLQQTGLVTIDAPRSQALIGFVKAQRQQVRNLAADVSNPFCTILLSSMEDQPIETSSKLLLIAGGPVENTGQTWNAARTDVVAWGTAPTMIDPVTGIISLRNLHAAHAVVVQPIDGAGQPLGPPIPAKAVGSDWKFPVGSPATTWYQITVTR